MQQNIVLIGTYHKTGTVWMQRVFLNLAAEMGVSFTGSHLEPAIDNPEPGFYLDDHSRFPEGLLSVPHAGFRMIRDPRDVVISGAHYHMKSHEAWLHRPLDGFDGLTYQQAILAEPDAAARYIFEARQEANATTLDMVRDCERLSGFKTVRYEDWIADETMADFAATMSEIGLSPEECDQAKKSFYEWSLFGKGKDVDTHARSGKVAQWRTVFTRPVAEAFLEVHGDALITLGYEKNHDWVLSLPPA